MERFSGRNIFRLNSLLGGPTVTFIEFRVDPRPCSARAPSGPEEIECRHTGEIKAELMPAAGRIKDESLREQFLRAAAKCLESGG